VIVWKGQLVMASTPSPPADEHERVQARRTFVLLLIGPAVLFLGGAFVVGGLFLPWYRSDARYLVGDPYPSDFQPFVPMQSFSAADLYWLVLAAIPILAALACLLIDAISRLRWRWVNRGSAIFFGVITLLAAAVGIISLILSYSFLGLAGTVPHIMDFGYFVSLAGYIILAPGAILLMFGQIRVSQMALLGSLRATRVVRPWREAHAAWITNDT
jgi:hypothetical protein